MNTPPDLAAWATAGGDPARLALLQGVAPAIPLTTPQGGRALVFPRVAGPSPSTGAIGDVAGPSFAARCEVLAAAEHALRGTGATHAVGPLEGNTAFRYRATLGVTPRDPLLPFEPLDTPDLWRARGWREEARYQSVEAPLAPRLARPPRQVEGVEIRPARSGDTRDFRAELEAAWEVTNEAFTAAWRFSPLPKEVFVSLYLPYQGKLPPACVQVAVERRTGAHVGYAFTYPLTPARLVFKTLALRPAWEGSGVASLLVRAVFEAAAAWGATTAIHALMADNARSLGFGRGDQGGTLLRRYALYTKRL